MDVAITELEKIEADRIDGVGQPANGIPILMLKQVGEPAVKADGSHPPYTGKHSHPHPAMGSQDGDEGHEHEHSHDGDADHGHSHAAKAQLDREAAKALAKAILADLSASPRELYKAAGKRGQVDEAPDIELGNQIIALLGQAIAAEAQEVAAGNAGEVCDIQELACALQAVRCWRDGEQAVSLGDVMPASMLMQSAAFVQQVAKGELQLRIKGWEAAKVTEWTAMLEEIVKAKHSAADRRKLAEQGNALSDGSYPIADEHDLHSAAVLARSGHGDVAAAKRLIARRAKELGVANPLDDKDDASKAQIAKGATDVDTGTQGDALMKGVQDAVAKAMAPLEESLEKQAGLLKGLGERLAKVEAAPIPGGPVLSRNVQVRQPGGVAREDWAAKAAYYREMAETVTDRPTADGYRKLAREADEKAALPAAT